MNALISFINMLFTTGSGSDPAEDVDAVDGAPETDKQVHQLQTKIQKTMDQIRFEQAAKEENVNEYLRVSTAPDYDKQQMQKIKALFERKNLKSTQMLSQYQKKLDGYKRKLKEIQTPGSVSAKQPTTHKQVRVRCFPEFSTYFAFLRMQ